MGHFGTTPLNSTLRKHVIPALTACLVVPVAFAQEKPQQRPGKGLALEEVIVTAQRREQSLLKAPVAVTALSAVNLQKLGVTDTLGLAPSVPNMAVSQLPGTPGSAAIFIRGLGQLDPQLTSDVKVGVYIDGVYMARLNNAAFDLAGVQRVEVLRGPQGTLYGRNTTGGAINIVTKKPKGEFGFGENFSYGSYGYLRSITRIDTPTAAGFSASVSYLKRKYNGFVRNTADRADQPQHAGEDDTDGVRAAVHWQPIDSLSADLTFSDISANRSGGPIQLSWSQPGGPLGAAGEANASQDRLGHVAMDFLGNDRSQSKFSSLTIDWDLGTAKLRSITGYAEWEHFGMNDQDGGEYIIPNVGHLVIGLSFNDEEQHQFTQEFQLLGNAFDNRLDYLFGIFYFKEATSALGGATNGVYEFTAPTTRLTHTDYHSYAAYGQLTYRPDILDQKLGITLGGRYTVDDKTADQLISAAPIQLKGSGNWNNFSWTVILDYSWTDAISSYAKVSTGYDSGGFNIRDTGILPNGQISFEKPFDEETLTAYELGLKSELFDKRLRLNVAGFYTKFNDMQVTLPVFPLSNCLGGLYCTEVRNAGTADMKGLELELTALLTRGLSIQANASWIDAEVTKLRDRSGVDISKGTKFQLTPKYAGQVSLIYEFPAFSFGTLSARVDVNHRERVYFIQNSPHQQYFYGHDRTLVNGRVTLSDIPVRAGNLQVALWGKNLTDEEYRVMGIDFSIFTNNSYGPPRSFGLDIIYKY